MGLLVTLNLNIPHILFATVIIISVIFDLIEGNLRSLHLNIYVILTGFKIAFFIGIYKVTWGCLRLYEIKLEPHCIYIYLGSLFVGGSFL